MKRFLVVLSLLACFFGLSVSSMAYQSKSVSEIPFIKKVGDVYKFSEVLLSSKFTGVQLEKWKEICSLLESGGTDDKFVVVMVNPNGGNYSSGLIDFILVDGAFHIETSSFGSSICSDASGFITLSFSLTDTSHSSYGSMIINYFVSYSISIRSPFYILRGAAKLNSVSPLADDVFVIEDADRFLFEDDLGTSATEPEEPDPPSSSEPSESIPDLPKPGDYNPTLPTIPSGDGLYVPYDTAVWDTFLERTKQNIGSATNIGFLIFGIAVVWSILTRLVKKYTKP